MVSLEKIVHLAQGCNLESLGPEFNPHKDKLNVLGAGTKYDVCTSSWRPDMPGVCHSFNQDGRCISLFKTLFTNYCTHQCNYCQNAANSINRSQVFSYTPEELAQLTLSLYRLNYVEGLFLSSGAGKDEDLIMDKIIETARLLRLKYGFSGYIHLKILPGASFSHVRETMELADRVSINLEATSASHLEAMCPTKDFSCDILQRQKFIRDLMTTVPLPAGQTTQLVIGASNASDAEIFQRMLYEYIELKMKRTYYSAFSPQQGTPFEFKEAQPLWREHRLYQTDWLYRIYRFSPNEIKLAFDENGYLGNFDPKMIIAKKRIDLPLDPNNSSYKELLHVPGIGPKSARRILAFRKMKQITRREQLSRLGVRITKAEPFLKINGWKNTTLDRWSS
ncbi:MAG: radical SAM protein [Methanotrichaceae archaeon]|nr:radical SAM protein [Methanotrichaceae archaeon]